MLRLLPVPFLLLFHLPGHAQTPKVILFEPLELVDTLSTAKDSTWYLHSCAFVTSQGRWAAPPDVDFTPSCQVLLVKRPVGWWVYDLPVSDEGTSSFEMLGFSDSDKFFLLHSSTSNLARGQETAQTDLLIVDVRTATMATLTTSWSDFRTSEEGTERQLDHRTAGTTTYRMTGNQLMYTCSCTEDSLPVPCADPGGIYRITEGRLTRQ